MNSAWNIAKGEWALPWPQRVSQHDIVYLSPPDDSMQGLPIGNGDVGALLWTDGRYVHLAVNKVDTWDDGPERPFESWDAKQEENQTALRGCGKITLDFGLPMWDTLYLSDFKGRVSLSDATAKLRAESPFGSAEINAYVSRPHNVLVLRTETQMKEPVGQQVTLERFGSRTFGHWYSQVNRDPSLGLSGTVTEIQNGRIILRQQFKTLHFVVAMALVVENQKTPDLKREHSRSARYTLEPSQKTQYTLYLSVVTSENASDPLAEAHARVDAAMAAGEPAVYQHHADDWKNFWLRSFVYLSDSYVANIWHTTLYLASSCSRGSAPPHFCNALWNPTHDYVPWVFFLEWNLQWPVLMFHPAGAADLALPYLNYRFKQLPIAQQDAREEFKAEGAFYSDISNGRGYQQTGAHVRVMSIMVAMHFWRHYQFTQDLEFLRTQAWPVMREVAKFMLTQITLGEDGKYHPAPDTAYEGIPIMRDVITSLAMIRAFFPMVMETVKLINADDLSTDRLNEILQNLPEYRFEELREGEYVLKDGKKYHSLGLGQGKPVISEKVPVAGFGIDKNQWLRTRLGGMHSDCYGVPDAELCLVFPAGLVGIKDKGSDLYNALVTFARFHPTLESKPAPVKEGSMDGADGFCMGWCPISIICARLGLKDETIAMIHDHIKTWQMYPQGFGHYGPYSVFQRDLKDYYRVNSVRDAANPEKTFPFRTWPFRHFDNEAMPIVTTAVNEMLLQSHEGIVRLCPAVPDEMEVAFTLMARGGFKISTEKNKGQIYWVWVESVYGNKLILDNPWPGSKQVYIWSNLENPPQTVIPTQAGAIILETQRNKSYLIGSDKNLLVNWRETPMIVERNEHPKQLGPAILGKPRMF
jgi:alpha-L-fucosidase 2